MLTNDFVSFEQPGPGICCKNVCEKMSFASVGILSRVCNIHLLYIRLLYIYFYVVLYEKFINIKSLSMFHTKLLCFVFLCNCI